MNDFIVVVKLRVFHDILLELRAEYFVRFGSLPIVADLISWQKELESTFDPNLLKEIFE